MTEAMKDSKTRWLGQIPADWDMVRVKDCFDRKNKKANQKDPIVLSLARSGVKIRDISSNEGQLAADYTNYNPVAKDDVLINPMDLVSGDNCNISRVEGVISPAYVNLRYKKGINPRFYNYYFKLQYWLGAFFAHGFGVSFDNRWTLSYETLSKYPLVLPPSDEQDKIADFLDEKCAEIDQLSEDIQKQIDILEEYKKSVITRAVTKGLNPNVEMKDSGIKWIGNIPKNYELSKVKYHTNIKGRIGFRGYTESDLVGEGEGAITLSPSNLTSSGMNYNKCAYISWPKYEESPEIMIKNGDVLFVKTGSSYGKSCYVTGLPMESTINPQLIVFKDININSKLFSYIIETTYFKDQCELAVVGGTIPTMSQNKIGNFIIIKPSDDDQAKLLSFLDTTCSEIDSSIQAKYEQITHLETYKKSIIYEYVTGKKRVA